MHIYIYEGPNSCSRPSQNHFHDRGPNRFPPDAPKTEIPTKTCLRKSAVARATALFSPPAEKGSLTFCRFGEILPGPNGKKGWRSGHRHFCEAALEHFSRMGPGSASNPIYSPTTARDPLCACVRVRAFHSVGNLLPTFYSRRAAHHNKCRKKDVMKEME